VILAGGKSSRMKEDKCFLPYKNTTLVEYQYNKFKQIFKDVYISSKIDKFDFECKVLLENDTTYSPLIALDNILNTLQKTTFIVAVDTPNITIQTINKLIDKSKLNDISIAKTSNNKIHYLCGVFHHNIVKNINNMLNTNNHKISDLIKQSHSYLSYISCDDEFINLNTKEDYLGIHL
jgi:molybdopterin-guanine dinucleotide biosynthesis protein A